MSMLCRGFSRKNRGTFLFTAGSASGVTGLMKHSSTVDIGTILGNDNLGFNGAKVISCSITSGSLDIGFQLPYWADAGGSGQEALGLKFGTITFSPAVGSISTLNFSAATVTHGTAGNGRGPILFLSWPAGANNFASGTAYTATIVDAGVAFVPPSNVAPINTVPGAAQAVAYNTPLVFNAANGNLVSVTDANGDSLTTTLSLNTGGTMTVVTGTGAAISNNGTAVVIVAGSIAQINASLNGMTFTPSAGFSGAATLNVSTTDGSLNDSDNITLNVATATSLPPKNNLPGAQATLYGGPKTFALVNGNLITVSDADSSSITTTVSCTNGTMRVQNTGVGATVTNNDTASVQISGTVAQVNAALDQIQYRPNPSTFVGKAVVTVLTTDGLLSDQGTIDCVVAASGVNPPPIVTCPTMQDVAYNSAKSFPGVFVSDAGTGSLSVTLSLASNNNVANCGTVMVAAGSGATVTGDGTANISVSGTLQQIAAALATLTYNPATGFNGMATLTVTANDGTTSHTNRLLLYVAIPTAKNVAYFPNPLSGTGYAFGARLDAYKIAGIKPAQVAADLTAADNKVKAHFDLWRIARIRRTGDATGTSTAPAVFDQVPNAAAVQFSDLGDLTRSEAMGYGMLLMVYMAGYYANARKDFDAMLTLVRARPAYKVRNDAIAAGNPDYWLADFLHDWRLKPNGASFGDAYAAPDGDIYIAQALLMADRQWGSNTGPWKYAQEAANTIRALEWDRMNSLGAIMSMNKITYPGVSRTSDWMFSVFRMFQKHTIGSLSNRWAQAHSHALTMATYVQNTLSSAHLVPDFVNDANTTTPTIAPNGSGDPGDGIGKEGWYFYNACRNPWLWAEGALLWGDTGVKARVDQLSNFAKGLMVAAGGAAAAIDDGYDMAGVSVHATGEACEFMGPFMAGMCTDASFQAQLNTLWDWNTAAAGSGGRQSTNYYEAELQLLPEILTTGNAWVPWPGNPPVNTCPTTTATTNMNTAKAFGASVFAVADADSTNVTTILSCGHGTISVVTGGGAVITNNGTASVTIAGTIAQVNAALATVTFTPTTGFVGSDAITMETTDSNTSSKDRDTVAITVGGGLSAEDLLQAQFDAGNTGFVLDGRSLAEFYVQSVGTVAPTLWTDVIGRWLNHFNKTNGRDATWADVNRPGLTTDSNGKHAVNIVDPATIANAGADSAAFYIAMKVDNAQYAGTYLSDMDQTNPARGKRIRYDGTTGRFYLAVGTGGAAPVEISVAMPWANTLFQAPGLHLIEAWYDGTNIGLRIDKSATLVTTQALGAAMVAGNSTVWLAKDFGGAGNANNGPYYYVANVRNYCYTSGERDVIATFVDSLA